MYLFYYINILHLEVWHIILHLTCEEQNACAHTSIILSPKNNVFEGIGLRCRTLTTPVKLLKCLSSIKEHAFTASEYPVVITLEDHLTPDLQAKVANVSI